MKPEGSLSFEILGEIYKTEPRSGQYYNDKELVLLLNERRQEIQKQIESELHQYATEFGQVNRVKVEIHFEYGSILATGWVIIDYLGKIAGAISLFDYVNRFANFIKRVIQNAINRNLPQNNYRVHINVKATGYPFPISNNSKKIRLNLPMATLLTGIIAGGITIFMHYKQKEHEINLERQKFEESVIENIINKNPVDEEQAENLLIFCSYLKLIDISNVTGERVDSFTVTRLGKKDSTIYDTVRFFTKRPFKVDKWNIKTLADKEDVIKINFRDTVKDSIKHLIGLPVKYYATVARQPEELKLYQVSCTIESATYQKDKDYHLILSSGGYTMIGEIPDPAKCNTKDTSLLNKYKACRDTIDKIIGVTTVGFHSSFPINLEATITGVGFIDNNEKDNGAGFGQFEIHPILKIDIHKKK